MKCMKKVRVVIMSTSYYLNEKYQDFYTHEVREDLLICKVSSKFIDWTLTKKERKKLFGALKPFDNPMMIIDNYNKGFSIESFHDKIERYKQDRPDKKEKVIKTLFW